MGDSYVTATHPALNSVCCYTLGGKPPCQKLKRSSTAYSRGWTSWKPVGASAATTHPWSLARWTTAGDLDQVQADPAPPAEPPGVARASVPPLSAPPLTTARAAATSACRPAVAVRSGVMSGSGRSTTTAVLHRGHRYAPDAPHQPRSQSQWLADVIVD